MWSSNSVFLSEKEGGQTFYVFFCTLSLFDRWHLQSELHQKITFSFTRFAMHFALHLTYAFEAVEVQTGLCNRKHWVLDTTVDFDQRVKLFEWEVLETLIENPSWLVTISTLRQDCLPVVQLGTSFTEPKVRDMELSGWRWQTLPTPSLHLQQSYICRYSVSTLQVTKWDQTILLRTPTQSSL